MSLALKCTFLACGITAIGATVGFVISHYFEVSSPSVCAQSCDSCVGSVLMLEWRKVYIAKLTS